MRKDLLSTDFDLIRKCCNELGIGLVPAQSQNHITLTSEDGEKEFLDAQFNLFENFEFVASLDMEYFIGIPEFEFTKPKNIIKTFENASEYQITLSEEYGKQENAFNQPTLIAA